MKKGRDLSGEIFGKWTVLSPARSACGMSRFLCRCTCLSEQIVCAKHLLSKQSQGCRTCCYKFGVEHPQWKGCGDISSMWWNTHVMQSAYPRTGREAKRLEISIEEVWALYLKQNGRCALTGLHIDFTRIGKSRGYYKTTASLDRIDSSKGYIPGNVQWVHKDVNKMKNSFDEEYFAKICDKVAMTKSKLVNGTQKAEDDERNFHLWRQSFSYKW